MNLNIFAYIIYLIITAIIIIYVGNLCYTNGKIFIQNLLKKNKVLANQINKLMLIGYYLLNIGYCFATIISWEIIDTTLKLIEIVSFKISLIILIIAIMHYINIFMLNKYIHKTL